MPISGLQMALQALLGHYLIHYPNNTPTGHSRASHGLICRFD